MRNHRIATGSAAAIFACPVGPRPTLDAEGKSGFGHVLERVEEHHTEVKRFNGEIKTTIEKTSKDVEELGARLSQVEQKIVRRPGSGGGSMETKSLGQRVIESEGFKAFAGAGARGTQRIEVKTITSASGSAGAMVTPDYQTTPVVLPKVKLTIRNLVAPGKTQSNMIFYPKMVSRSLLAAPVAENPSAVKPQSDLVFIQAQAPVQTIAHWIPVSQQAFADAPALSTLVDSELRYGLQYVEEAQLLFGDGTGVNILGIMPQATAFNGTLFTVSSPNMIDTLLMAMAQSELALLPATGIVLHPLDYFKILALKDSQGRYLAGGPLEPLAEAFWSVPKVTTPAMTQGSFLVGAFQDGAQIFDREDAQVLLSTEDRDNFVKNMVTCLGEERLACCRQAPVGLHQRDVLNAPKGRRAAVRTSSKDVRSQTL